MVDPKVGDVLHIGGQASVQFAGSRSLIFRVTAVCEKPTYVGWCWLTGYVLDRHGAAIDQREVFVQRAGLRRMASPDQRSGEQTRRPAADRAAVFGRYGHLPRRWPNGRT